MATDKEAADFLRSIKDQLSDDGPESTPTDTSPEKNCLKLTCLENTGYCYHGVVSGGVKE